MYRKFRKQFRPEFIEHLEVRAFLDCAGVLVGEFDHIEYEDSALVSENPDGTLRFASLRVGATPVQDDEIIAVGENELTMGQVKNYLQGFADSIGTNSFIETLDFRVSAWGTGSGSTSRRFNDFMVEQLTDHEPCSGLRFTGDVRFELPGTGGELFTGGFLDLPENGLGTLLRGGDIAEVVEDYEISAEGEQTTLTVVAQFGEMEFVINKDQTLTDEFDRIWTPRSPFEIVDPNAVVDAIIGDINGDGRVDFADFLILSDNFGSESEDGDLNGDGKVDFADFLLLSDNFGKG